MNRIALIITGLVLLPSSAVPISRFELPGTATSFADIAPRQVKRSIRMR